MTPAVGQIGLKESGVMEQNIGRSAPPELKIMAAVSIGGLRWDSVTPCVEEYFQVLTSLGDFLEPLVGPIVEVYPRG